MTVRRDGGGLRRLTDGRRVDTQAAWSPDGRRIAFASASLTGGTFDIRVIGERGGRSRVLVGGPAEDVAPSWSTDGRRLLFVRVTASGAERWEARADGTRQRRLGPAADDEALERTLDRLDASQRPRGAAARPRSAPARNADRERNEARLRFGHRQRRRRPAVAARRAGRNGRSALRPPARAPLRRRRAHVRGRGPSLVHAAPASLPLAPARLPALRAAARLDFALVVRDRKTGFCLADHYGHAAQRVRNFGPPVFLGNCEQGRPGALAVEQGSSPGYTDRYPAHFHGQDLELQGVPAGVYVLVHRANEHGLIEGSTTRTTRRRCGSGSNGPVRRPW